ncbi:MAG: biotin/lipoyl-containing protein [Legionellaceae bacterium]|nr:biotin/lipoyl-containing protein [Legionellaceae bacterium]
MFNKTVLNVRKLVARAIGGTPGIASGDKRELFTAASVMHKTLSPSGSSSNILTTLSSNKSLTRPFSSIQNSSYLSPYDINNIEAPLDYIVIHNRSKNAADYATRQLKDAWPNLKIIHVVQDDRDPIPGSDGVVRIKDWANMTHFKEQFDKLAAQDSRLNHSMKIGKVGFYCVWSAPAENSNWAISAKKTGFQWIGASPDKMKGLDKIEYKKRCQALGIPTADFVEILPPDAFLDKEEHLKVMAHNLVDLYHATPELAGKPVFVKHNEGGGGRGTIKVSEMNFDNALEAIRKIINETGGNLNGVYAEQALDLEGAQLFQIEIEWNGASMAPGGRLVWFNKENQKVLEVGFTDSAIREMIPQEVYEACRAASQEIFVGSGYDGRGTNEILIIKDKYDNWRFKALELNKRIQVENEALSELVVDYTGRAVNVAATQVLTALGLQAPVATDLREKGPAIVGHVRLLSCEITATGSVYPGGLEIDGAIYPQGANVQFVKGPVYLDADPQIGRALITANTWTEFCNKLLKFAQEFQFYGPKTETSTYFDFLRKLASDAVFRAGKLGCNNTFNVLTNPPVLKGKVQKIVEDLSYTATPLITHGYRPNEGVKDQPYPTPAQMNEFIQFMENLRFERAPNTEFSRFLVHNNFDTYIQELKVVLADHGGGTVTATRDVWQSMGDQESALMQKASVKISEIFFAGSGIGVGFETGGAQYQAALMRKFDWMAVLLSGCLSNLPSHSLTRSKWLNGLTVKSPEEQAFVFRTIAGEVTGLYGLPRRILPFIPWMPYNFHAGNHPEQDITTREMLRANLAVIPNWAWDARYTEKHFRGWVTRQIDLFQQEGKPLYQIRIKNPGQGPHWNVDVIVKMVQTIRQMFKERGLEEPIIFVHNHEFDGRAAHIGAEAIRACQQLDYPFLIVDSAPPGTSHNSNLIISKSFNMSSEEKDRLRHYNQGMHLAFNITRRFNNQNITNSVQDPDSEMAGGTNSSDLADAIKMKIPIHDLNKLIGAVRKWTGLGTAVTPYSEWIKQIAIAIWINNDIQPKTVEAAEAHIKHGGQLAIAVPILEGLREWKTLLVRKDIIGQLLINHGMSLKANVTDTLSKRSLDIEAERVKLQAEFPRTNVTDREISTVIAFDKIGRDSLNHRDHSALSDGPRDMTVMMNSPGWVHSQYKKAGDSFNLHGEKITVLNVVSNAQTGKLDIDFSFQGHIIRTSGIDPNIAANTAVKQVYYVKDKKTECGAPMAGAVIGFFVKPGDPVKKGQLLATMEAMKMEHNVKADADGVVDTVKAFDDTKTVESGEVLITFRP